MKTAVVASSLFLLAVISPAATTEPAAPTTQLSAQQLADIQSKLHQVQSVQADFVQEKRLSIMSHTITLSGRFALAKPDRFIWIVDQPVRYAIRIQGEEVQQWDQDTNKVETNHLGGDPTFKAVANQMQAWFLGDYEVLAKSYDVQLLSEKPLSLGFTPAADSMVAAVVKHVAITFAEDERYIDQIVVDEVGGDKTTLKFIGARVNEAVPDDVWRMPPNEH